MYIRHLIGPRKGEVEDIVFDRAKAKVAAGEAEDVYSQLGAPKVQSTRIDEVRTSAVHADSVPLPRNSINESKKKKSR